MSKRFELNANKWYAEIDCDLGANITRLSYGGKYVYNPLNGPNLLKENPFIYGSPILLPAHRQPCSDRSKSSRFSHRVP